MFFTCCLQTSKPEDAPRGRKRVQKKKIARRAKESKEKEQESDDEDESEDDSSSESIDYDTLDTNGKSIEDCIQVDCAELQALLARK